jgi:hypothetical protein
VFSMAMGVLVIAAGASLLRGGRYVHDEQTVPAAPGATAAAGTGAGSATAGTPATGDGDSTANGDATGNGRQPAPDGSQTAPSTGYSTPDT